MRRPPPPHPRGAPRTPGSGRQRGTPNRKTVELRALLGALAGDAHYQQRLREDFRRRRIHPAIESLVWAHTIGKPPEKIQFSGALTMSRKLEEERELFGRLSLEQMEAIAEESQALVDKVAAMARANTVAPVPSTAGRAQGATINPLGPQDAGDESRRAIGTALFNRDDAEMTAPPAGEPKLPAAGLDDALPGVPAGLSTAQQFAAEQDRRPRAEAATRDTL